MEQFNLEKYLANPSRKVVTRNFRNVRIICTDRNNNFPIVALVVYDDYDEIYSYTKDGKWRVNESTRHDLFFAPQKHEGWINVFRGWINVFRDKDASVGTGIFNSKEEAEKIGKFSTNYVTTIKIEWED